MKPWCRILFSAFLLLGLTLPHFAAGAETTKPELVSSSGSREIHRLITELTDKNPKVCRAAEAALVQIGPDAVLPLASAAQSKINNEQIPAEHVLSRLGKPVVVSALLKVVQDGKPPKDKEDSVNRFVAIRYLGKMGDATVIPVLMKVVREDKSKDLATRGVAAQALGEIHDPAAVPVFIRMLEGTDPEYVIVPDDVRNTVFHGNEAYAKQSASELNSELRYSAVQALGNIGDARANPALQKAAKEDHVEEVREAANQALIKVQAGSTAELATKATNYLLDNAVGSFALYPGRGWRSFVDPKFEVASLDELEVRVSQLPPGTRLYWSPYRLDLSGEPMLFKEGQFEAFQSFCQRHSIILTVSKFDYAEVVQTIANEIAIFKNTYPELKDFSPSINARELSINYAYHTHKATHAGGWTAGVPNPDDDGLWFYIDFHDPQSTAQIHTQPMTGPAECLGKKRVSFLILTGKNTRPVGEPIRAILQQHGVRKCDDLQYGDRDGQ